jgi:hypothetical protein
MLTAVVIPCCFFSILSRVELSSISLCVANSEQLWSYYSWLELKLWCCFADVYMAPEIYKDEIFDRSVDAYSFGVVLYEVLCRLIWQAGFSFLFPSHVLLLFLAQWMVLTWGFERWAGLLLYLFFCLSLDAWGSAAFLSQVSWRGCEIDVLRKPETTI